MLAEDGFDWLRLVDNGVVRAAAEQMDGLPVVRAYHLIPAEASKARAVARHMQARGYGSEDCIAVGDSREDMDDGSRCRRRSGWSPTRSSATTLESDAAGRPRVRIASESYGAGVYEAVVTTLAER